MANEFAELDFKMLKKLKKKQNDVKLELELLESRLFAKNTKNNIIEILNKDLSICAKNLDKLFKKYQIPQKILAECLKLISNLKKNQEHSMKTFSLDLEHQAFQKLIQLYKMQLSINTLTEQFYQEQLLIQKQKLKKTMEQSFLERLSKRSAGLDMSLEISNSMAMIRIKNDQFLNALKKNLQQLTSILEPSIEKSLNFLVLAQQKVIPEFAQEFSNEKLDIEANFREISEYLQLFYSLLQDFTTTHDHFDKFSEISENQFSFHRAESEDLDPNKLFLNKSNTKIKESNSDASYYKINFIVKLMEEELELDRQTINHLKTAIEKINQEKEGLEVEEKSEKKCKCSISLESKLTGITKQVGDIVNLLTGTIELREFRMKEFQVSMTEHKIESSSYSYPSSAELQTYPCKFSNNEMPVEFKNIIEGNNKDPKDFTMRINSQQRLYERADDKGESDRFFTENYCGTDTDSVDSSLENIDLDHNFEKLCLRVPQMLSPQGSLNWEKKE